MAFDDRGLASLPPPTGEPEIAETFASTPVAPRMNVNAVAAFVTGIVGLGLGIFFAHDALQEIKKTGERGRALAIAGAVFSFGWILGGLAWAIAKGGVP